MRGAIPRKDRFAAIRCGLSGLCVDHGQPFHNPVREGLPTTRPESQSPR
jgi:hypothetical protein